MTWKNLLVFADGSEAGLARVQAALTLARRDAAHVEAVVAYRPPQLPLGLELAAIDETYERLVQAARAEAAAAVQILETLEPPGQMFSARVLKTAEGPMMRPAANAVYGADLVVVAQPDGQAEDDEVLQGALFGGGAPCLVMPRWPQAHAWGTRALVAWKATPQAARALRAALPLLAAAKSVRLLLVDSRGASAGEDQAALERLAARLLRHGVRVETPVIMRSTLGEVGRAIADEAEGYNADLVVMGAYGHARITEWTFGGVTRHMLAHAKAPLVMAH